MGAQFCYNKRKLVAVSFTLFLFITSFKYRHITVCINYTGAVGKRWEKKRRTGNKQIETHSERERERNSNWSCLAIVTHPSALKGAPVTKLMILLNLFILNRVREK